MSRTIFYGPKDVRAIEVRLYFTNKASIVSVLKCKDWKTVHARTVFIINIANYLLKDFFEVNK